MSAFPSNLLLRLRYPLAIVAGLMLAAAFPNLSIAGLAWIAPGLMLAAALGCAGKQSFRIGFIAGFAFWLASLNWLLNIPVAGFPILGWVALSAYNALFQGIWVWLCWKCFPSESEHATRNTQQSLLTSAPANPKLETTRLQRLRWTLLCAALWVALEMIRCRFLSGFPWSLLGSSQYQLTPLLQMCSVTGVYGVSFLVVWTSVCLMCATLLLFQPELRNSNSPTSSGAGFQPASAGILPAIALWLARTLSHLNHRGQDALQDRLEACPTTRHFGVRVELLSRTRLISGFQRFSVSAFQLFRSGTLPPLADLPPSRQKPAGSFEFFLTDTTTFQPHLIPLTQVSRLSLSAFSLSAFSYSPNNLIASGSTRRVFLFQLCSMVTRLFTWARSDAGRLFVAVTSRFRRSSLPASLGPIWSRKNLPAR